MAWVESDDRLGYEGQLSRDKGPQEGSEEESVEESESELEPGSDVAGDSGMEMELDSQPLPYRMTSFLHDHITVSVAKTAPLKYVTVSTIQTYFGAKNFLLHLKNFLDLYCQQSGCKFSNPSQYDVFNVYKQAVLDVQPGTAFLVPFHD